MDIQALLICIGLVILSGTILLFTFMFDMRKKTFEEAMAEHRKMPEDSYLLGPNNKVKSTSKNEKKQVKRKKNNYSDNKENLSFKNTNEKVNLNSWEKTAKIKKGKAGEGAAEVLVEATTRVSCNASGKGAGGNNSAKAFERSSDKASGKVGSSIEFVAETVEKGKGVQCRKTSGVSGGKNKGALLLKTFSEVADKNKFEALENIKNQVFQNNKVSEKINDELPEKPIGVAGGKNKKGVSGNTKLEATGAQVEKSYLGAKVKGSPEKGEAAGKGRETFSEKVSAGAGAKTGKNVSDTIKKNARTTEKSAKKEKTMHKENSHVNFINPESKIMSTEDPDAKNGVIQETKKKKNKNKDSGIKPILINKEEHPVTTGMVQQTKSNHFSKTVPKDELELKHPSKQKNHSESMNQDDFGNKRSDKDKSSKKPNDKDSSKDQMADAISKKNSVQNSGKSNKNDKSKTDQPGRAEPGDVAIVKSSSQQSSQPQQKKGSNSTSKEKKRDLMNSELYTIHQIIEKDRINSQLLIPLIQKAELTRIEVQDLTDLLLTKHTDNEFAGHSEWIEGKQDPVVKLKKQLAEKEKALTEEQEVSQAFQNRIKELRSEINAERARLGQACRQYEETVMAKQNEIQNLLARNRHLLDSHVSEKQALTQKLQQLQAQINDANIMIRKLQEENSQTHNALQQELVNQRQQMEMHVARVNEQHQESENNLKAQLHAQLQELEQLTGSFNAEIQKNRRNEEELRESHEQLIQNQNKIKALESRASQLKESTSHTQELTRQIEELQRVNEELESRLSESLKIEEDLKFEKLRLQNEVHNLASKMSDLQNDFDRLLKEKEKFSNQVASKIGTEKELMKLKEENQNLFAQVASLTKLEKEAQQLREENENLAAQMTAFTERPAADGRENGDSIYNEEQKKNINIEFINHENEERNEILTSKLESELHQKKMLISSLNTELSGCQNEISRLSSELIKYKTEVPRLYEELEEQKNKNNDLRRKNGKAMDALASTEKCLETKLKETEKIAAERASLVQAQEQEMSKNVLQRIFPDINIEEKVYDKWLNKFEDRAKQHLKGLTSSSENSGDEVAELENKNSQLSSLVTHYKSIIEDTEGMLNKLQSHVEQEEIRWNQEIAKKDVEINTLKKDHDSLSERYQLQMETKVKELERRVIHLSNELHSEKEKFSRLKEESERDRETVKKLSEEKDVLSSELASETEKLKELKKDVVKLQSTVKIGQAAYEEEHKTRLELENMLTNRKHDGSLTDGVPASTEKPKPKKVKWQTSGWFRRKLRRMKIQH